MSRSLGKRKHPIEENDLDRKDDAEEKDQVKEPDAKRPRIGPIVVLVDPEKGPKFDEMPTYTEICVELKELDSLLPDLDRIVAGYAAPACELYRDKADGCCEWACAWCGGCYEHCICDECSSCREKLDPSEQQCAGFWSGVTNERIYCGCCVECCPHYCGAGCGGKAGCILCDTAEGPCTECCWYHDDPPSDEDEDGNPK